MHPTESNETNGASDLKTAGDQIDDKLNEIIGRVRIIRAAVENIDSEGKLNATIFEVASQAIDGLASVRNALRDHEVERPGRAAGADELNSSEAASAESRIEELLARKAHRSCKLDLPALRKMGAEELYAFRGVLHTVCDVLAATSGGPNFFNAAERQYNRAGETLDDIMQFLSAYEDVAVRVAEAIEPDSRKDAEWKAWTILSFYADYPDDLPSFAVRAAEAARGLANAEFRERQKRLHGEHWKPVSAAEGPPAHPEAERDPVLELYEEWVAAKLAWIKAAATSETGNWDTPECMEADRRSSEAEAAMLSTRPTSTAGIAALVAVLWDGVRPSSDPGTTMFDDECSDPNLRLICAIWQAASGQDGAPPTVGISTDEAPGALLKQLRGA